MKRKGIHRPTIEEAIELSAVETLHPGGLALTRRTAELAGIRPGLSVLDVSCGRGTQSVVYAREFGADVVGLDLSQAMLKTAKARASEAGLGPSVRFVQGDSQDLPFPDGSFDVVVNECAVGIPDDSQKVLNEMLRVARPGGRVLMHESTWRLPLPTAAKEDFAERYGTTPLEVEEWVTMLERAGAKRISVEEQPWSRPEMFWKIRADRNVRHWRRVLTPREKLRTLVRILVTFGLGGVITALHNEGIFYREVRSGSLGYALFAGEK